MEYYYYYYFAALISVVAISTWSLFRPDSGHRNLPPGPYPFPIVGNILQIGQNPHRSLTKLSKEYGPLMSLQLGRIYTIVVSSPEIAKEILQKHDHAFSGRTIPAALQAHDHHKISVAYLPVAGKEWRKLRKLSKEQLFTSSRLEAGELLRREKLEKLCDYVRKCSESGRTVNVGEAAFVTTLNLMSATLFSADVTTFDSNATEEFRSIIEGIQNTAGVSNFSDYFPVLQPLDPQGVKRMSRFYLGKLLKFIEDLINQRLIDRSKKKKKNDFLDALLDLQQDESDDEYEFMSIEVIKHFLLDLFVAGSGTTSSTVEWVMTELLVNPGMLLKAKEEISYVVVGDGKRLNESEIMRLPYLQAVIKETFRFHPPGPLLVPRKSEYDAQVSGYSIPKGTQVIVNVWAMGRDPTIWSNPESFEPKRFLLDDDNNNNRRGNNVDFKGQDFELIPFGAGRRICPGLPLANRMLHIMVATLIHNFDWKLVEEEGGGEDHKAEMFGLALHKAVPLMAVPIKPS